MRGAAGEGAPLRPDVDGGPQKDARAACEAAAGLQPRGLKTDGNGHPDRRPGPDRPVPTGQAGGRIEGMTWANDLRDRLA